MVILDYPYSDASGSKVRPALVVQVDVNNARLANTIVALVTKNIRLANTESTHLLVDITTPDGQASGLRVTSAVTCNNLFTVHQRHVIHRIGSLTNPMMEQVDRCLKAALGIA